MKKIFSIILLLLIACSPVQPQETPAPEFAPLVTPSVFPTNASTVTVIPTWTENYDGMIATASAMQTQASFFPRICDNYSPSYYSPNGLWLEEMCYSEEDRDLILTVSNKETGVLWKLLYHDYLPKLNFFPDGHMTVAHWSKDGQYAYFLSDLGGDGNYCFVKGWDRGAGLFRLDLENGTVSTVLPPNTTYWWYDFSFSPTDKRLVYGVQGKDFYILDMAEREPVMFQKLKEFEEGGGVVWAEDGLQFVYSTIINDYENNKYETSVRLVDSLTGKEEVLIETINDCYSVREWIGNTLFIASDAERVLIEFDLISKNIIHKSPIEP